MSDLGSEFLPAYCTLISSPVQLAICREASSLTALLQTIKNLWNIPDFDDNQLLAELNQLNQQVLEDSSVQLAGTWLPYRYHAKSHSVYWCLPEGHATEPFQDETISRYRRKILLNNIIQPQTSLDFLTHQARSMVKTQPAGFIFHLSRCGSTLISGCLSELDSTCVMSESPVLTEVLLDKELDDATQQRYLRHLIDLQACVFPERPNIIIKWNAWDIFHWQLIHEIYPLVPTIFLVRNPADIITSHQRSTGRHMSGDPALACVDLVFNKNPTSSLSLLDFRISVLSRMLAEMQSIGVNDNIRHLDYRQLGLNKFIEIGEYFQLPIGPLEAERIKTRLIFNSKFPGLLFDNDSTEKQSLLTDAEITRTQQALVPLYMQFIESN